MTHEFESFESGSVRKTQAGKSRPDLISPFATYCLGHELAEGAKEHAERNWEKGQPISRCIASHDRHMEEYKMGLNNEDHLVRAYCNLMFAIHMREMVRAGKLPKSLDDMPRYLADEEDKGDEGDEGGRIETKPGSYLECIDMGLRNHWPLLDGKLIYLASPYSTPRDKFAPLEVQLDIRAKLAMSWAAKAHSMGLLVFSPIAHSHGLLNFMEAPLDVVGYSYWQDLDRAMLNKCDLMVVLHLPEMSHPLEDGSSVRLEYHDSYTSEGVWAETRVWDKKSPKSNLLRYDAYPEFVYKSREGDTDG